MRRLLLALTLLVGFQINLQGALLFGGATSDRCSCGTSSSLAVPTSGTLLVWAYPTSVSAEGRFFQKGTFGADSAYHNFQINGAAGGNGSFRLQIRRATTDLDVVSAGSVYSANTETFFVATWNTGGANGDQHLYVGTRTSPVAEVSYTTQTVGSGSVASNSGAAAILGNNTFTALAFTGSITIIQFYDRVLIPGEIAAQQHSPHNVGAKAYWLLGANGTTSIPDWTGNGNNCTIIGATVAANAPLGRLF